jgi:4-amino-4-deoxy-L-arabinose transferase-like glycosyltransferase
MSTVTAPDATAPDRPEHPTAGPGDPRAASRAQWWALAAIGAAALVFRVGYVLVARRNFALQGDDFMYHWGANALADGRGFLDPLSWKALGRIRPSAAHPPLYTSYLAVVSWFGGTSALAHRLASTVLGAGGVVLVGMAARRIAGPRAMLLAAGLAAVYPMLWINDGMLISESLYVPLVAATILFTYRLWDTRAWRDAVILGGIIGLGALTRPEAVLLVPLLGVPFLFARSGGAFTRRLLTVVLIGATCFVVILPWWVRNLTTFREPVFLATGHGTVLESANCPETYAGEYLGYWNINCVVRGREPANAKQRAMKESKDFPGIAYILYQLPRDESVEDVRARKLAFDYIEEHPKRATLAAAARVGRVLGVFRVQQQMDFDVFFERRGRWPTRVGTVMWYAFVGLSVVALIAMRRRGRPISPPIAIFVGVVFTTAIAIGITRYRIALDVTVTALAGVGIDAIWRAISARRTTSSAGEITPDVVLSTRGGQPDPAGDPG